MGSVLVMTFLLQLDVFKLASGEATEIKILFHSLTVRLMMLSKSMKFSKSIELVQQTKKFKVNQVNERKTYR